MLASTIAFIALVAQTALPIGGARADVRVEREAWVMGTRLRIVAEAPAAAEASAATEILLRAVERWDGILSTWAASARAGWVRSVVSTIENARTTRTPWAIAAP